MKWGDISQYSQYITGIIFTGLLFWQMLNIPRLMDAQEFLYDPLLVYLVYTVTIMGVLILVLFWENIDQGRRIRWLIKNLWESPIMSAGQIPSEIYMEEVKRFYDRLEERISELATQKDTGGIEYGTERPVE